MLITFFIDVRKRRDKIQILNLNLRPSSQHRHKHRHLRHSTSHTHQAQKGQKQLEHNASVLCRYTKITKRAIAYVIALFVSRIHNMSGELLMVDKNKYFQKFQELYKLKNGTTLPEDVAFEYFENLLTLVSAITGHKNIKNIKLQKKSGQGENIQRLC